MEQEVWKGTSSKPVYLSQLANAVRRAASQPSLPTPLLMSPIPSTAPNPTTGTSSNHPSAFPGTAYTLTSLRTVDPLTSSHTTDPLTSSCTADPLTSCRTADPLTSSHTADPLTSSRTAATADPLASTASMYRPAFSAGTGPQEWAKTRPEARPKAGSAVGGRLLAPAMAFNPNEATPSNSRAGDVATSGRSCNAENRRVTCDRESGALGRVEKGGDREPGGPRVTVHQDCSGDTKGALAKGAEERPASFARCSSTGKEGGGEVPRELALVSSGGAPVAPFGVGRSCSNTVAPNLSVPAPAFGTKGGEQPHVAGPARVPPAPAGLGEHSGLEDEAAAALFCEVQACMERYSTADVTGRSGEGGNEDLRAAVIALERLQRVKVSADFLRRTGMGRALKQLSKAGTLEVSAAAAAAVVAFKKSLLERGEMVEKIRDPNVNAPS